MDKPMLALFDLDNTLLAGDSDHLWGEYLVERGHVDGPAHRAANDRFYAQYQAGTLDIQEFLRFQLAPLAAHPLARLEAWRADYLATKIDPIITPAARALVASHRERGHVCAIITATNRFITGPIAARFGIEHLIATEPEFRDGRYTGRPAGVPCFREGKVTRLRQWLDDQRLAPVESWFYSDSHNDLPLLREVTHPVAVDPDPALDDTARSAGWRVLSLRG